MIEPKCLVGAGSLAFSATGHLLPCCWYDNHKKRFIPQLIQDKFIGQPIDKILESEEWTEFISKLENNPESLPHGAFENCYRYCKCESSAP